MVYLEECQISLKRIPTNEVPEGILARGPRKKSATSILEEIPSLNHCKTFYLKVVVSNASVCSTGHSTVC